MIEISRTTHTYVRISKTSLENAVRFFLGVKKEMRLPGDEVITLSPDGAIIEFTEHEGPEDQRTTNATQPAEQEREALEQILNDELCDNLAPPPERLEKYLKEGQMQAAEPDTTDKGEWAVFPEKIVKDPDPCNKPWPAFPPPNRKHLSKD